MLSADIGFEVPDKFVVGYALVRCCSRCCGSIVV